MKELSIEEKAKRYDKAIEIAKKINNEHKAQPFDVMLKVFSELKESEDEKIRKQLLKHLREAASGKSLELSTTDYERWATWLEKQGEQKPVDKVEPKDYNSIDPYFGKPVNSYCQENCKGFQETGKYFADEDCKAKREAEQKSAWSEEDELMLTSIIQTLKLTNGAAQMKIDWLKSLRPQNTWKPSEEQFNNTSCTHLSKEEAESKVWKQ